MMQYVLYISSLVRIYYEKIKNLVTIIKNLRQYILCNNLLTLSIFGGV